MRRTRTILISCAVAAGAVAMASPASADHVADIIVDGTICRMGGLPSGIGLDMTTTDFHVTTVDGVVTGYVCHFTDIPERVTPEENQWGHDWTLPRHAYTVRNFECWPDDGMGEEFISSTDSTFTVTPNGKAVLHCRF